MVTNNKSKVIYGDSPFVEDMGVLTTLCLLHEEVLLFGWKPLDQQFDDYRRKLNTQGATELAVVEDILQLLIPEGVIIYHSPKDVATKFLGSDEIEFPGIEVCEETEINEEKCRLVLKADIKNFNHLTWLVMKGLKKGKRTVASVIRDASLISAAAQSAIPIVCEHSHITLAPSVTRVSEVATFLSHRTFHKLALPELRAYHVEDILEARLKLKAELQEFRAGILDLVWLLHQRNDLAGDLRGIRADCDILIETKIAGAVLSLEHAISTHKNKKIQRILKATGGALLEFGKSLIAPTLPGLLMGGSGGLLKLSESIDTQLPQIQVASFLYKVCEKKF